MANIITQETNSIFLDISPYNLVNVFQNKVSIQKIMYKVFKTAKELQPAVIFFDETEHFFGKKNLKKLKHFAGKCSKFKKELISQVNKHLTPSDRVVLIGCTKNPQYVNVPEAKKFFYKKFYFPIPDYSARREIFQTLFENHVQQYKQMQKEVANKKTIEISENFPYSLLAYHTEGFSVGTIHNVIQQVLIPPRLERIEIKALNFKEFCEPLSEQEYTSAEVYQQFKEFTWGVCYFKELNEQKKLLEKENAKNAGKNSKKK